jgi:hypothetical protein
MAQTNFTPIQLYRSSTASAAPTSGNLVAGELAINTADGKLFYLDNLNAVQVIGWKLVPTTAGGTGLSSYTTGDTLYSSATNTLAKLPIGSTGQVLTVASGLPAWSSLPAQVYPGAGIPNSTGSAWATSYGVTGSNNVVLSTSPTITGLIAAAGTTTVPSLKLTNGTNLTTTTAGAIEYDGSAFYNSVAASTRGVMPSEQIVILDTAYTLTSQTAAQKLFNASTNGAVTLPVGTYQFECQFALSSLASPSAFGFAMVAGTAVIGAQGWTAIAAKGTALTSPSAATISFNTAPSLAISSTNVPTTGEAIVRGIIKITTAGTIIPSVSLSLAAAAVVSANSYFKISPVSGTSAANITIGNWS